MILNRSSGIYQSHFVLFILSVKRNISTKKCYSNEHTLKATCPDPPGCVKVMVHFEDSSSEESSNVSAVSGVSMSDMVINKYNYLLATEETLATCCCWMKLCTRE